MGTTQYHTPITGTPDIKTAINAALADLDAALNVKNTGMVVFEHLVNSGTGGGTTSGAAWYTRTLNTISSDLHSLMSIDSNKFTPLAGTYLLIVFAGAFDSAVNMANRMRLYNVTQTSEVFAGMCGSDTRYPSGIPLLWIFTANGTDEYRVDHYAPVAEVDGLGIALSLGIDETHMQGMIVRLGS